MHGFSYNNKVGTYHDFDQIIKWISEYHPGQIVISLDFNNGEYSMLPMWSQIKGLTRLINTIVSENESFSDGYHFIGHSQGALLLRSFIQLSDNHSVEHFISMAGVHQGIYGINANFEKWLPNMTLEAATDLLYTELPQDTLSFANWWQTPIDYQQYLSKNVFLPVINGVATYVSNDTIDDYRTNFLRTKAVYLFGSPQDGTVEPWISEHFGFFNENLDIVNFNQQTVFIHNTFGLRTMFEQGRLNVTTVTGIEHSQWLSNETNFVTNIMPLLT